MRQEGRHIDGFLDAHIAEVAARQHGVVSVTQLRGAGLQQDGVEARARKGQLHRVHRGVYAVGHHQLLEYGRLWAAILACGGPERAALSHASAAAVWDLLPPPSVIHATTLAESRSMKGMRVHRAKAVATTTHQGLPVTTVAQTLLDLAATTPSTGRSGRATAPSTSASSTCTRSTPSSLPSPAAGARRG